MKKLAIIFTAASLLAFKAADKTAAWNSDKTHSNLKFTVTHLMVSDVEGSIKNFDVKLYGVKDDFSDASVEFEADINTINTDNEQRDAHLKSADFFDAAKYPKVTFKSGTFKKVADKKYQVSGNLTMHGVTRFVTLDATLKGTGIHPMNKKNVAGFKVSGTIKRSDFGIGASSPDAIVSDEVAINANLELNKN